MIRAIVPDPVVDRPLRRAGLASGNPHKARELAALWFGWSIELVDMAQAPYEVGVTFWANAVAKARYGRTVALEVPWVIGEDSGIEAAALGGAPGVRSARFAGAEASDQQNVECLLEAMASNDDRRLRYVSELACVGLDGEALRGTGVLTGTLAAAPRGSEGFGYDPIFVPDTEVATVAELGNDWKARHSHRAHAARALLRAIEALA